jgi:hypothetical protein
MAGKVFLLTAINKPTFENKSSKSFCFCSSLLFIPPHTAQDFAAGRGLFFKIRLSISDEGQGVRRTRVEGSSGTTPRPAPEKRRSPSPKEEDVL